MAGKAVMNVISSDPGDGIKTFFKNQKRKKMLLDQGQGKYAAPLRYAVRQTTKNVKNKIKDFISDVKSIGDARQAKLDAGGKRPGRNSSVGVCDKGGKCQN